MTEFSGDNERREFIRQSKDLILWGTHCASEEKKGFICVFRSTSAYVVEMIFSWDTLRAAVQYHLVGEGYQIKAVRTGGSFVVGQVIGVDGKDKHEIHLWHSGKSGETGSITWAHPLDENGKETFIQYHLISDQLKARLVSSWPLLIQILEVPSHS